MTVTPRVAARVLVVDPDGRVLLFRGFDPARPDDGTWWLTPGGGVDGGETLEQAARRELFEETGLAVDAVGPALFERRVEFDFEGVHYDQTETYYCVRAEQFPVMRTGWMDHEHRSMFEHRWWTVAELAATDEKVYPEHLVDRLTEILGG